MIMFSGWGKNEIEKLEVGEIVGYINRFRKIESERIEAILKVFAAYNLESTRFAFSGSKSDCEGYLRSLSNRITDNDIEKQFEGVNFG